MFTLKPEDNIINFSNFSKVFELVTFECFKLIFSFIFPFIIFVKSVMKEDVGVYYFIL